jgi:SPP1 family phage portal protein
MSVLPMLPTWNPWELLTEPENRTQEIANAQAKQADFVLAAINEWRNSPTLHTMEEAQRYYEAENVAIARRKRMVFNQQGSELINAPWLANNHLIHAFLRKLLKQKTGYVLGSDPSISSSDETFSKLIGEVADEKFFRVLRRATKDAVMKGISWIQAYYDEVGELRFKRIPSQEIVPFWQDADHTLLTAAIRVYTVESYDGSQKKKTTKVQYFTTRAVFNYILDNGLTADPDAPVEYNFALRGTETSDDGTETQPILQMWDRIPLIPVKYNDEEESLLKFVKPLIDDYDMRTSDMANALQEEPDKIKVITNYDGASIEEFMFNLVKYRVLFLQDNGAADTLDNSIDSTAHEAHLTRIRRDLFEMAGAVDTQNKELGNASGVALRFLYSDLDMDCADLEDGIRLAISQMLWFVRQDWLLRGRGDYTDESKYDVKTTFNISVIVNEAERIQDCAASAGIVSEKTILEHHPWVTDVDEEIKQLDKERQESFDQSQLMSAASGGTQQNDDDDDAEAGSGNEE